MGELDELKKLVVRFRDERNWKQYHTPKNLTMALGGEVGELQDLYLWDRQPDKLRVEQEMADIFIYLLSLADVTQIDLYQAVILKLYVNDAKYPIEKFMNNCEKST